MKNLYVCEFCGSTYEDPDVAYKCERSHHMLDFGTYDRELREKVTYNKGQEIPGRLIIPSESIEDWNPQTCEYDPPRRVFGEYKLVRILTEKESAPIVKAYEERHEREEREWQEYWERRKAEKEAKEQAEKAESEAE